MTAGLNEVACNAGNANGACLSSNPRTADRYVVKMTMDLGLDTAPNTVDIPPDYIFAFIVPFIGARLIEILMTDEALLLNTARYSRFTMMDCQVDKLHRNDAHFPFLKLHVTNNRYIYY